MMFIPLQSVFFARFSEKPREAPSKRGVQQSARGGARSAPYKKLWLRSIVIGLVVMITVVQAQQTPTNEYDTQQPAAPQQAATSQQTAQAPLQLYPEGSQVLTTVEEVAQVINSASSEIMLATGVLRSPEIAEALRDAVVTRGVAVYILAPEENVTDSASYFASLALAGAGVALSPVEGSFLTVDRQTLVTGVLVSGVVGLPGYEDKDQTVLVPDPAYTAAYVDSFYQSFTAAPVFDGTSIVQQTTENAQPTSEYE